MDNLRLVEVEEDRAPDRDITAMIAMLDYLIGEITRIDAMSAQCLIVARKALAERIAEAQVRAH